MSDASDCDMESNIASIVSGSFGEESDGESPPDDSLSDASADNADEEQDEAQEAKDEPAAKKPRQHAGSPFVKKRAIQEYES